MDEQLLNEYINNLANQVNTLNQENILLKTRLGLLERREQERLQQEELVKQKMSPQEQAPQPEPTPSPEPASTFKYTPEMEQTKIEEPEPNVEEPKKEEEPKIKYKRAQRPKGYNREVDGPLPLIPEEADL
jgi:hypothetical protein